MKKYISLAAMAALVLCSCQKELDDDKSITSFEVNLPGSILTKAVEQPQSAGVITPYYNDVTVFLVDKGNNATPYTWTDAEIKARSKRFEQISEPASVIVVANAGSATLPTSKTTKSNVYAAIGKIAAADQNIAKKTLSGEDEKGNAAGTYYSIQQVTLWGEAAQTSFVTVTPDDGHSLKKVEVQLKSEVSRFEANTVTAGLGLDELTVTNVYINYIYQTKEFSSSWAYTQSTWPATYTPVWATDAGSAQVDGSASSLCYAYQVLTGDMVPHIVFEVSGKTSTGYKLSDGTEGAFTNKYVTVKGFKVGSLALKGNDGDNTDDSDATTYEMQKHEIYKLAAFSVTPDQIGPPEEEDIDLIVNITVAPWTVQNITPEI